MLDMDKEDVSLLASTVLKKQEEGIPFFAAFDLATKQIPMGPTERELLIGAIQKEIKKRKEASRKRSPHAES